MKRKVALFGEAERGEMNQLLYIRSLDRLNDLLGTPPEDSMGIFFGIQFLLFQYELVFVRVKEEGFSTKDYLRGMQKLLNQASSFKVDGVCLPGVGDSRIIDYSVPVAQKYGALLITTERDLYDYLTSLQLSD